VVVSAIPNVAVGDSHGPSVGPPATRVPPSTSSRQARRCRRGTIVTRQSIIGDYDTLVQAEDAVRTLDRAGFPIRQVSNLARDLTTG
jgi:hypothetical protein